MHIENLTNIVEVQDFLSNVKQVSPQPGTPVNVFFTEAIALAKITNKCIIGRFNHVSIAVWKDDKLEDILIVYNRQIESFYKN